MHHSMHHVLCMKDNGCHLLNNEVIGLFRTELDHPGDILIRLNMFDRPLYSYTLGIYHLLLELKNVAKH